MASKLAYSEDLTTSYGRPMSVTTWHAADPEAQPGDGAARCAKRVTVTDEDYAHRPALNRMNWCPMCRSRA